MSEERLTKVPLAEEVLGVSDDADGCAGRRMPLPVVGRLFKLHRELWRAEDESRRPSNSDGEIARIRRKIEGLNLQRSRLIEGFDVWVAMEIVQNRGGTLHTETLGSVVERLCIARTRTEAFKEQLIEARDDRRVERYELAKHQMKELGLAHDLLVEDVLLGRRRLPEWRALKSYGEAK